MIKLIEKQKIIITYLQEGKSKTTDCQEDGPKPKNHRQVYKRL